MRFLDILSCLELVSRCKFPCGPELGASAEKEGSKEHLLRDIQGYLYIKWANKIESENITQEKVSYLGKMKPKSYIQKL